MYRKATRQVTPKVAGAAAGSGRVVGKDPTVVACTDFTPDLEEFHRLTDENLHRTRMKRSQL